MGDDSHQLPDRGAGRERSGIERIFVTEVQIPQPIANYFVSAMETRPVGPF
jgi:hypothetical protein